MGQIKTGQTVRFRVDAYPSDEFTGAVEQVRLNAAVTENVVTYAAMISAPNPQLKLKPGMTANLTIEVARRSNVLGVPAAALRFSPSDDVIARFGAKRPDNGSRASVGTLWIANDATLEPVPVRVGVSDGSWTELIDPALTEGALVVTQVKSASAKVTSPASTRTSNPLLSSGLPPGPPPR